MQQQLQITWMEAAATVLAAIVIYGVLILLSRLVGPRSFARLTAFDFAVTVALGAVVGATATGGAPLLRGVIGLGTLFLLRWLVAKYRRHGLATVVDNAPIMLMDGPQILPQFLKRAKITEEDLLQSLRRSGITNLNQVRTVVMERDGSISVLKSDAPLDPYILKGVIGHPPEGTVHATPPLSTDAHT